MHDTGSLARLLCLLSDKGCDRSFIPKLASGMTNYTCWFINDNYIFILIEQHEFFGKDQGLRIRDLLDPTKKMSKSDETGKGVIFLSDSPDEARKKIMSATTDSLGEVAYDYKERPGVSNLLDLLKLLGGNPEEFIGQTQYGPLKAAVADRIREFLGSFQTALTQVDESALLSKLEASEETMRNQANETLAKVQKAVGLRP